MKINGMEVSISLQRPFKFNLEEARNDPETVLRIDGEEWIYSTPGEALFDLQVATGNYGLTLGFTEDLTSNGDHIVHIDIEGA